MTDKWLPAALRRDEVAVVPTMLAAVDLRLTPEERFDALWRLWEAVDHHAVAHGIAATHLAGSPFVHG